MKEITEDWLKSAQSDLQLIEEILSSEHLSHLASFHSQQAIEKFFKAIVEEYNLGFIKTHSLENLYATVKNNFPYLVDENMLIILDQLYIDARYPGELGLLPHGKPTISESQSFYMLAKKLYEMAYKTCKNA